MFTLDATTKTIELILDAVKTTTDADYTVCYYDVPSRAKENNTDYRLAHKDGVTNGTTLVTAVAAPGQNVSRNIVSLSIYNADNAAIDVTVRVDTGGTKRILVKQTLNPTDTLFYEDGRGWVII